MARVRTWRDYAAVKKYPILEDYVERWNLTSFKNEVPAILSYFYVMGQTVVDYIRVPIWDAFLDPRIHVFWIQPTRTGKTIAWNFIGDVLVEIGIEKAMYSSGSDAGLIGTVKQVEEDGEQVILAQHGLLKGKKAMLFDEGSTLLQGDKKAYTTDTMNYLQGAMNPIGTDPNILSKPMAAGVVECQSSASLWITTFPVPDVRDVVLTKGLFQRVLLYVAHWEMEDRRTVSVKRMSGVFKKVETDAMSVQDLAQHFVDVQQRCRERVFNLAEIDGDEWYALSDTQQQKKAELVMHEMFDTDNEWDVALQGCVDEFYSLLTGLDAKMCDIVCSFMPNIENHLCLFAAHLALTEGTWTVRGEHLEMSLEILYDTYERLITWLESDVEIGQARRDKLAKMAGWKNAFGHCEKVDLGEKHGDNWVQKSAMFVRYMKQEDKSRPTVYDRWRRNGRQWFSENTVGKVKYVRWKGDN